MPPKQDDYHRFRALPDIPADPDPLPARNGTNSTDSEQVYWEIETRPPFSFQTGTNLANSKTDFKNRPLPPPPNLPPFGYRAPRHDFLTIPADKKSSKHDFPAGQLLKRDFLTMPTNQSSSKHATFTDHPSRPSALGHVYPVTTHNHPRGHRPPAVPARPPKLDRVKNNPTDSSSEPNVLAQPNLPPKPVKRDFLAVPNDPTLPDLPPRPAQSDIPASKPDIPPAEVDVLPELPPEPVSKPGFPEIPSRPPKPVKPAATEPSISDCLDVPEPHIPAKGCHPLSLDKPDVPEPSIPVIPDRPPKPVKLAATEPSFSDCLDVPEPHIPAKSCHPLSLDKPDVPEPSIPVIPDRPPKPVKLAATEPSIPDRSNKPDELNVPELDIPAKGCHPLNLDKPDVPVIPDRPPKPDKLAATESNIDCANKPVPEPDIPAKGHHLLYLDKPDVPEPSIPVIPDRPSKPDKLNVPVIPNRLPKTDEADIPEPVPVLEPVVPDHPLSTNALITKHDVSAIPDHSPEPNKPEVPARLNKPNLPPIPQNPDVSDLSGTPTIPPLKPDECIVADLPPKSDSSSLSVSDKVSDNEKILLNCL